MYVLCVFSGTSNQEFLRMLCGDEEEHAVLLYCWLRHMDVDCTLLLGTALPEGRRAAYVLVRFR
jgi:coiled-coil and C2 domain-containing protein 2A